MSEPGPHGDRARLAAVAKALGHPTRVQIVAILLARQSCMCGEIVDLLPVAQATVSQHLKVLRGAGVIDGEIDGPRVCYCVNRDVLDEHVNALATLLGSGGVAP